MEQALQCVVAWDVDALGHPADGGVGQRVEAEARQGLADTPTRVGVGLARQGRLEGGRAWERDVAGRQEGDPGQLLDIHGQGAIDPGRFRVPEGVVADAPKDLGLECDRPAFELSRAAACLRPQVGQVASVLVVLDPGFAVHEDAEQVGYDVRAVDRRRKIPPEIQVVFEPLRVGPEGRDREIPRPVLHVGPARMGGGDVAGRADDDRRDLRPRLAIGIEPRLPDHPEEHGVGYLPDRIHHRPVGSDPRSLAGDSEEPFPIRRRRAQRREDADGEVSQILHDLRTGGGASLHHLPERIEHRSIPISDRLDRQACRFGVGPREQGTESVRDLEPDSRASGLIDALDPLPQLLPIAADRMTDLGGRLRRVQEAMRQEEPQHQIAGDLVVFRNFPHGAEGVSLQVIGLRLGQRPTRATARSDGNARSPDRGLPGSRRSCSTRGRLRRVRSWPHPHSSVNVR